MPKIKKVWTVVTTLPPLGPDGVWGCQARQDAIAKYLVENQSIINLPSRTRTEASGCIVKIDTCTNDYWHITTRLILIDKRVQQLPAHRISFMIFHKRGIKAKLMICHKCDNRACINPHHLYEGDHKANGRDISFAVMLKKIDLSF